MSIENIKILPNTNNKKVLFFWASWHESSKSGSQMDIVFQSLATTSTSVSFHKVEAEVIHELSTKYNVAVVPTFILLNNNNTLFRKVEGANPALLTQAVSALLQQTNAETPVNDGNNEDESDANANLNNRIKALLNSSKVLLFMKGNPTTPKCGFSRQIVELLQSNNINTFSTFDILTDPEIRQGLKTYSDWPTYPQLYVNGELVGGLDIVKEMIEDDADLAESLGIEADVQLSLDNRLHSLTHKSKVMLFMKGNPSGPKCGFSRQIVELLQSKSIDFDTFDILEDEEVRQGLKKYSDWPTYPQVYIDGELIGGLDIVREMSESGDLTEMLE